jgi:hypothetical protein
MGLQRDRLRHQLPEHDREVRQDRERHDECDGVRERRLHEIRDQRLADRTDEDREDRDAELRARDEAHGLVHEPEGGLRATVPVQRPLLEARTASGDQRVLGRDEDRTSQHEEQHHDDAKQDTHARSRLSARTSPFACSNGNAPRGAQVLGG